MRCRSLVIILSLAAATLAAAGASVTEPLALRLPDVAGSAHGFPVMRDAAGAKVADGEFFQSVENGRLQVRLTYDFGGGHRVEDQSSFRVSPALNQETWRWTEWKGDAVEREFRVDFGAKQATARKREGSETKQWTKELEFEPGRTFAGFGFTLALQCLGQELAAGRQFELQAIGFTPQPRVVTVVVSHAGLERVTMAGRAVDADCFVIHPKIPLVARPFVHAPDTRIWLIHAPPVGFLRWRGTLAEPDDAMVQVDLLPSNEPAPPTGRNGP